MKFAISDLRTASPFKDLFPIHPMTLLSITNDMKRRGFAEEHPVVLWAGHKSIVLDGHTRIQAASDAGLVDVPVVAVECADEDDAVAYAIACQRNRRNLTDADILRCVTELDKRKTAGRPPSDKLAQPCANSESEGKTSAATAATIGVSQRKVEQARTVLDRAEPETKAAVLAGEKSINAAYRETVAPPPPNDVPATETQADDFLPAAQVAQDALKYLDRARYSVRPNERRDFDNLVYPWLMKVKE